MRRGIGERDGLTAGLRNLLLADARQDDAEREEEQPPATRAPVPSWIDGRSPAASSASPRSHDREDRVPDPRERAARDQPRLNSVPDPTSDSSLAPVFLDVVADEPAGKDRGRGRNRQYEPTANDSEWIPHSSRVMAMHTPTSTRPHGRFWLSSPLMIVDISVACGAGSAFEPMTSPGGGTASCSR